MKKLTLIGDSIRMIGYGLKVPEVLKDEFEVFQPEENCRFAKYTLRGVLHEWAGNIEGSDVIHWNNGLWDVCDLGDGEFSSLEEYTANMVRIANRLKKLGKKVIFATTTPVSNDNPHNSNSTIIEYNKHIVPILSEMGIIINDLHSAVYADIDAYIRKDDKIHLTEAGIDVCTAKVVEAVRNAAKE